MLMPMSTWTRSFRRCQQISEENRANSVSELTADAYIKSVSGNIQKPNILSITYVVGGVEETVDFTSADVTEIDTRVLWILR